MNNLIESPPRTIMELYKSLPEGTLAELIDNTIYMSPAPKFIHQKTSRTIARQIENLIVDGGLGEVISAPFDVYLDEKSNAIQPDITVVLTSNIQIIAEDGSIHGVPDMLIEILSKGNEANDTVKKMRLYESFGVKEYWIIEPTSKLAMGYTLVKDHYKKLEEEKGIIQSLLLKASFKF
jgi:Uma2 family endonuclease